MADTPDALDSELLRWLHTAAGYPACRLEAKAELLVCFAAAARSEEQATMQNAAGARGRPFDPRAGAQRSSQRAWDINRSRVHMRCDNGAKV